MPNTFAIIRNANPGRSIRMFPVTFKGKGPEMAPAVLPAYDWARSRSSFVAWHAGPREIARGNSKALALLPD